MFSQCFQSGNSIELYNGHDKNLFSKWKFIGRYSKIYDSTLRNFMHILDIGSLSKMEIPNSSYRSKKSLSLFQSYIVFQIYLFTSKQFSIEISISDTTRIKRRLIFSTNNKDLILNQLHCRVPIINFPIGEWINFSIDILSFVSECFKDLTFRSIDYISLSMSGKVREIFTMRTPLNTMEGGFSDPYTQNVPECFQLPKCELQSKNINLNCNRVINQIYLENQKNQINIANSANFARGEFKGDDIFNYDVNSAFNKENRYAIGKEKNDNRIAKFGNMIISGNNNNMKNTKELSNQREFINLSYNRNSNNVICNNSIGIINQNKNEGYKFFNKEEYLKKYNNKNNVASEVKKSIVYKGRENFNRKIKRHIIGKREQYNSIDDNFQFQNSMDINSYKIRNQLSTIKNEKEERDDYGIKAKELLLNRKIENEKNIPIIEKASYNNPNDEQDDLNFEIQDIINNEQKQRPFSPPLIQE